MNEIDECFLVRNEKSPSDPTVGCPPILHSAKDSLSWFVMRATYSREMRAKSLLEAEGVECYVPLRKERNEGKDILLPVVHNLIFVRTTREFMDLWKRKVEGDCPLRYAMDSATDKPMVVRDKEMEDFIRVTEDANDDILYLDNPKVTITKGKDVEIISGIYKGIRGKVMRILRDRRVVVSVNGIIAVALNGIPFSDMKEI